MANAPLRFTDSSAIQIAGMGRDYIQNFCNVILSYRVNYVSALLDELGDLDFFVFLYYEVLKTVISPCKLPHTDNLRIFWDSGTAASLNIIAKWRSPVAT